MTQFRAEPGERIIDVIRNGDTFVLTRRGKQVAKLMPVDDTTLIKGDGTFHGAIPLTWRTPLGEGGY